MCDLLQTPAAGAALTGLSILTGPLLRAQVHSL